MTARRQMLMSTLSCWTVRNSEELVDVVAASTTFVICLTTPSRLSRSAADLNAAISALALSPIDVPTSMRAAQLDNVSRDRGLTRSERNSTLFYTVMCSPLGTRLGAYCTWTRRPYMMTPIARSLSQPSASSLRTKSVGSVQT